MLIIDRIEDEWAVIEWDGKAFNLPRSLLPEGAREGDVLTVRVEVDPEATGIRRKRITDLESRLFRKS